MSRSRLVSFSAVAGSLVLLGSAAAAQRSANAPSILPDLSGTLGDNGWYVSDVTVRWNVSGETGTRDCDTRTLRVDTTGTSLTCYATDDPAEEVWSSYTVTIKLDKTPPAVTATAQRPPNAAGWYKDPVSVTFTASDATSKGEACEPPKTYSGPDSATASITGRCTDAAGNVGTRTRALRYDETAPRVRAVPGRRPDSYGWYGHDLRMTFVGADSISGIAQGSCTRKVYRGPNRAAASVTGKCTDKAGNTRFRAFSFKYQEPLLSPRNGRRVWRPLLNWVSVPNARYYNVQVWRSGQQIFNRWPVASQFRMPRTWVHGGVRYWMSSPGRYDWHVWPRFHGRYGKLVGHRYFIRR